MTPTTRNQAICRVPNCGKKVEKGSRGLCERCYQSARHAVRKKETSWEELERLGLAANSSGKLSLFRQAMLAAKKETQ